MLALSAMVRHTEIGTKEAKNGYLLCRCVADLIVSTLRYLILEWGIVLPYSLCVAGPLCTLPRTYGDCRVPYGPMVFKKIIACSGVGAPFHVLTKKAEHQRATATVK